MSGGLCLRDGGGPHRIGAVWPVDGRLLGYAVAAVYQLFDPDIVVLGGSVTRDFDVFSDVLLASAEAYIQPIPGRKVRLAVSEFDGDQVALGAAWYAADTRGLTKSE